MNFKEALKAFGMCSLIVNDKYYVDVDLCELSIKICEALVKQAEIESKGGSYDYK